MLDVLVCFRPFVRLHLFDPLERSSPHLLLLLFLLAPTSLVQRLPVVRGSRQHHYLPFTPSLSPPCEFSANPRRLAGSIYVFLPLPPVSCYLVHKESAHSCQSCSLPSGLHWELLSSFFKSTHHQPNSSYTQNSVLKMQLSLFLVDLGAITNPGMPGQAGDKLARLVRSWLRWF